MNDIKFINLGLIGVTVCMVRVLTDLMNLQLSVFMQITRSFLNSKFQNTFISECPVDVPFACLKY